MELTDDGGSAVGQCLLPGTSPVEASETEVVSDVARAYPIGFTEDVYVSKRSGSCRSRSGASFVVFAFCTNNLF